MSPRPSWERTRQSIWIDHPGGSRLRSMGVNEPPITIQKWTRSSAIRIFARSLTLPHARMTAFSRGATNALNVPEQGQLPPWRSRGSLKFHSIAKIQQTAELWS